MSHMTEYGSSSVNRIMAEYKVYNSTMTTNWFLKLDFKLKTGEILELPT